MAVDQGKEQVDELVQPDSESYKSLLDEYTHLAPAEGEVLQGTVLKVTAKDVIVDFGYKSEGLVPIEQFLSPSGEADRASRRCRGRDDRSRRAAGRLCSALPLQGRPRARVGQPGESLRGPVGAPGARDGESQGRAFGGRGHRGVHARLAGRSAPRASPGLVHRPGCSGQDRQGEPPPRQRSGFAQAGRRAGGQPAQGRHARPTGTRAPSSPAWSRI